MDAVTAKGRTGQMTFDGKFVTITREGFIARTSHGRNEKSIPLSQIAAVQFKPATSMIYGYLQLTIPGENVKQKRKPAQVAKDENAVQFNKAQLPEFEQMRDAIRAAL